MTYTLENVPTPALIIDLPKVQRNAQKAAEYCRSHNLRLRPHTKTHKSARIAAIQAEAGAGGLTAAKVGEARVMAGVHDDILLAYPCWDPARAEAIANLAGSHSLRVGVDTRDAVEALAAAARKAGTTIGILVDIDTGFHRTGVQSPQDCLALAQHVEKTQGVRLDGIMNYYGHIFCPPAEQTETLAGIQDTLATTKELWAKSGLEAGIVSGGSTPTLFQSHLLPAQTEIRPGTYIYYDRNSITCDACTVDDCAATILCTVVSDAVPGKVVLDGGSKTFTSDRLVREPDKGHGLILGFEEATIFRLSEEHGDTDISRCPTPPKNGQRVRIIPNHICPCINLQQNVWLDDGSGNLEPLPVDARGLLS